MKKITTLLWLAASTSLMAFNGPNIDTSAPGKYKITYTVTDSFGQSSQVDRIVIVKKNEKPVITLNGDQDVQLTIGQTFNDPGVVASDQEDGDITNRVTVSGNVDVTKSGTYTLVYSVTDTFGQSVSVSRTVTVKSNYKPVMSLNGSDSVLVYTGQTFNDPGVVASDQEDGDITNRVTVSGSVDFNTPGTYTRTYSVADTDGNVVTKTRTIVVRDNEKPVLTLNGAESITVFVTQTFTDPGVTANDAEDGDLTSNVTVSVQKID